MPVNRPRRGFTLTELLIAIGIIVLLIGLLLPVVTRVRMSAYGASTNSQVSNLSLAIQQYYDDFRAYPGPLPLNQINIAQSSADTTIPAQPFVYNLAGTPVNLSTTTPLGQTVGITKISGAQNLVLGLLGGLTVKRTPNGAGQQDITAFQYDPAQIFTTDTSGNPTTIPGPKGPQSLSINVIKTTPSYVTVKPSELSTPVSTATTTASFADAANRMPADASIPVFLDKYPDAMPIIYMRAQRGASGLVSFAGQDKAGGTSLASDPGPPAQTITSWQYDLREIYAYTNSDGTPSTSNIGVNVSKKIIATGTVFVHGLQKVWANAGSPPAAISSSAPIDAWVYLRNPDLGPPIPASSGASDVGTPRQKDGFILISAGPDRLYGTTDDITSFGSVAP
jgi:prepilin-type N-terminal cleavage/methylation domain-containing protein